MRIWLFVDEYGCCDTTPEQEYEEIEKKLTELLGDGCQFRRNMPFAELASGTPDIYVFDIGGMCYVDYSGDMRMNWCHRVLLTVADHPNTLFIPFSDFTRDYCRFAMEDLVPELLTNPNVFCPPKDRNAEWDWYELALAARLKEWVAQP